MNEIEFRQRLYSNPSEPDQDLLAAAKEDPVLQKILDQTQEFEHQMDTSMNSVEVPAGLAKKLLAIPASEQGNAEEPAVDAQTLAKPAANSNVFQYYAVAASLLLAVGVAFSLSFNPSTPSAEVALSEDILFHMYEDIDEISALNSGQLLASLAASEINQVMADSGSQLMNAEFLVNMPIRSAKPCEILPSFESAHLLVNGSQGAVSVIVINNSPVNAEFSFRDDRFNGVIVPTSDGNIILVGEQGEDLSQYKTLFSNNVEWVI